MSRTIDELHQYAEWQWAVGQRVGDPQLGDDPQCVGQDGYHAVVDEREVIGHHRRDAAGGIR
jgi:hypothetical protein